MNLKNAIIDLKKDVYKANSEKLMLSEKLEQVLNDSDRELSTLKRRLEEQEK